MDAHLPPIYEALAKLGAPLAHYKICSTLDSSPSVGSIGRAVELAQPYWRERWYPLLVAAPDMGRYQAFGQLFATAGGTEVHRIDRHPVMSRHPVTPMDEADVRRHLARQTDLRIEVLQLPQLRGGGPEASLRTMLASGIRIVAMDCVDRDDLAAVGRLIWEGRGHGLLAVGSQGVEYALLAYWRSIGALDVAPAATSAGAERQIVAVSGSVSPTTAAQIAWAADNGFALVPFEAAAVLDEVARQAAIENAIVAALAAIGAGRSVAIQSASGPDDPAVARFRAALAQASISPEAANRAIGEALGTILSRLLDASGLKRAVISGGDTSGHAALRLGIHALTALAPTVPGAALCRAHTDSGWQLELALKGGQMGSPDYFGWIREGGGPR
jgi:3-oxoisoapionate kinase